MLQTEYDKDRSPYQAEERKQLIGDGDVTNLVSQINIQA